MSSKQNPSDGLVYDETTHQWRDAAPAALEPAPTPTPAAASPKPKTKSEE